MSPVFRHGSLRLYLLRLLDEEPRHGYEIIRLLRDRFMGVYSPSPGTIYPRLARLEEEGLVTHDEVDGRKVYRITEAGREELRSRSDELDELEEELSASVSDIVREVREDVRQTVRSLREELTWAARESRRMSRDMHTDIREQARQARDEAREQARQAREEAREQALQTRDEAKDQARQTREDARWAREEAQWAREDAWGQATDEEDAWEQAADEGEPGEPGSTESTGSAGRDRAEALRQDAIRRVRERARRLREEAQQARDESSRPSGPGGPRDRIREEAGARFHAGEQDWEPPGWTGRGHGPGWTDWPGRRGWEEWARMRGRRGWTGPLDFGTFKDLERVAVQFTSDLRKLAMQSTTAGENVISDLRTILEEALERIKTEIFGVAHEAPGQRDAGQAAGEPDAAGSRDTAGQPDAAGSRDTAGSPDAADAADAAPDVTNSDAAGQPTSGTEDSPA
ncbi:MAG TPA: helix-turn-helix transcriptional regulator [Streptosporangiaceae bacterium]|nr:helix-turn-helix transcriptional regulator [Streptosporangiaceae bacterium]